MSFKARFYLIVALLAFVTLVVGGFGLYVMSNMYYDMRQETKLAFKVSMLKDIRMEIQNTLINVREMVLSTDVAEMQGYKSEIDLAIKNRIDPLLAQVPVTPEEQQAFSMLTREWGTHKKIIERIYDSVITNADTFAVKLSFGDSLKYWSA